MFCELCHVYHDGTYGSGRFCSKKCAKAFSTHKNRKDISEKVRSKLIERMRHVVIDVERLKRVLPASNNWKQVASNFDLQDSGSYVVILKRSMTEANIDIVEATKHFKRPKTLDELLSIRPNERKGNLREMLIKSGREYFCEECGQSPRFNGKKLVLQVDHKNGISHDHRLENLRFLCPNCHTQTDTYSWKNVRRKRLLSGQLL